MAMPGIRLAGNDHDAGTARAVQNNISDAISRDAGCA
jgi:hypothetical protein